MEKKVMAVKTQEIPEQKILKKLRDNMTAVS